MYFVRTAGEQDLEKVRALLRETWHATYDRLYGADKVSELHGSWHSLQSLRTRLAGKNSEFLVADDGKNIGGMAYAAMSTELAKTVMLYMLYVSPRCQRQGIGRDIFAELETCFPDAEVMRLEVDPQNDPAIAFYKAHGFIEVGRTENCGNEQSGIPALIFEKPLENH
ncbi:GNAT family N-acetyltransferase [Agrobacterium sp. SHOUNA12C]|uniref:Acetyltransferase protein n=2 Tax=Rhizobium rhizogenes TaxID=359 RepID=B9JDN5_RHIR8|nr:GNAT family N-acetyltransferase [Rhizobium rhizogenes]ACM26236.1 acetyltransferase protein [Rhizobium rhizogenes K84]KAA6490955.1 GNAT family N-acetyltransferase [Agrobacterium sp. ICMP 7243]MCJ9724795.1 GNAT family N-acetyltransferase [Agrobacterium sp. BETTINA12B]MCJ9756855.1 GNAT family N-acetyltransferase [Agrobacterium sp. SHOUNA12C]OCJ06409.1 GCN5 family acetyltransferase [Agrobacterium sp. 13-626]OCJ25322.1 GCN5 family acetyltransferase [Agrobacterium sp. B131/95]